jgi:hypothetical protein
MTAWKDLTDPQRGFLRVLALYAGVADNGNLMEETGHGRRTIARIGTLLKQQGWVSYTPVDRTGFEGGVWKLLRKIPPTPNTKGEKP